MKLEKKSSLLVGFGILLPILAILFFASASRIEMIPNYSLSANTYLATTGSPVNCTYPSSVNTFNACQVAIYRFDDLGNYKFTVESNGQFRFFLDGELVIDRWESLINDMTPFSVDYKVTKNELPIRIEYKNWRRNRSDFTMAWDMISSAKSETISVVAVDGRGSDTVIAGWEPKALQQVVMMSPDELDAINFILTLDDYGALPGFAGFAFVLKNIETGQIIQDREERSSPYVVLTDNGVDANPVGLEAGAYELLVSVIDDNNAEPAIAKTFNFTIGNEADLVADPSPSRLCELPSVRDIFVECLFEGTNFEKLVATRLVDSVSYNWGSGSPAETGDDYFSARWLGRFNFAETGLYRFSFRVDDGVRLFVDNVLVFQSWKAQSATNYNVDVNLERGEHDIRLEYYENRGHAVIQFDWELLEVIEPPVPDTEAPSTPFVQLEQTAETEATIRVYASTDNVAVTGYKIYRDGDFLAELALPGLYEDKGLSPDTIYKYQIVAVDASGNVSETAQLEVQTLPVFVPGCSLPTTPNEWQACYYEGISFDKFIWQEQVSDIFYRWRTGGPGGGVPNDRFSARWRGDFDFDSAGVYEFTARVDDGVRVKINGETRFESWKSQSATTYTFNQYLPVGRARIEVEYYENTGWATAEFDWKLVQPETIDSDPVDPEADTTPPSTPVVTIGEVAHDTATLSIDNLIDNIKVLDISVFRDGNLLERVPVFGQNVSYIDAGLKPSTTYNYTVSARDSAGNVSPTASLVVTTAPSPESNSPQLNNQRVLFRDYGKPLGGYWQYQIMLDDQKIDLASLADKYSDSGQVVEVVAGSSANQINQKIASAPSGSRVVFRAGDYNINSPVVVKRSNIRLDFEPGVIWNVSMSPGWKKNALQILGDGETGAKTYIESGLGLHSSNLVVKSANGFAVGDWVRVTAPFKSHTYGSANQTTLPNGAKLNLRSVIAKITNINGQNISFDRKIPMPEHWIVHPEYAQVERMSLVENVIINGPLVISYTNLLGSSSTADINTNPLVGWMFGAGVNAVYANNVARLSITDIKTVDVPSGHYWIDTAVDFHLDSLDMAGSHNTGSGGHGYDVLTDDSTNGEMINLSSIGTRHGAPATGLKYGNTAIHVHYKTLGTNIDFHGASDWGVTVVVDKIDYWHDNNGFRMTDFREVRVKEYSHVWFKEIIDSSPTTFDWFASTYPGSVADFNFTEVDFAGHRPGFRYMPGGRFSAQEQFAVNDGHMQTFIIGTTGPSTLIVNHGNGGTINLSDYYGTNLIVAPLGGNVLRKDVSGFKLRNNGKTNEGTKIFIPIGLNGYNSHDEVLQSLVQNGNNTEVPLGGQSRLVLRGIDKDDLTSAHIKVVSANLLARLQSFNYFSHMYRSTRPYLMETSPTGGAGVGRNPTIVLTYSEAVSHNANAGKGYLLDSAGDVAMEISPSLFTINGKKVSFSFSGLTSGEVYRFELPPSYFVNQDNEGTAPLFDWDSEVRPAYYQRNPFYFSVN